MHTQTRNHNRQAVSFEDIVNEVFNFAQTVEKTAKNHLYDNRIKANVYEEENSFIITAALPGVKKKDIDIQIKEMDLVLTVNAPTHDEKEDKHIWTEYNYGEAKRSFRLSRAIDIQSIDAKMLNGVLKITLAKKPAFVPQTITVK